MVDPSTALTAAITNATKVANTPLFTTVIDKMTGFKISKWAGEGEVRKKQIHDEYEKAKDNGITGIQYISALRSSTNLINTAVKSAKYIEEGKINEIGIENDFFWNTVDHSKNVSNEEIQELIAKIIAGEYNSPGTYSMSTLHTIKMLGKDELKLFERICSLLIDHDKIPAEIFAMPDDAKEIMDELKIDFGSLQTIQSLGLFFPNEMTNSIPNPEKKNYKMKYFDNDIIFSLENNDGAFIVELAPHFGLSPVGRQILKHLKPLPMEKYLSWLKKNYKIPYYKILEN
ncbi:DUF2806 domain-containing protein [Candidatus Gracilibacteria bacterium]|nr:DUF2806 domain-containing protein [Candidatus Gracilibacteria bacterium]